MDFGRLTNESFRIAWDHKLLWIFGLFAAGGGVGFNFNYDLGDTGKPLSEWEHQLWGAGGWHFPVEALYPLFVAVAIMVLAFIALHLICVPALIDGVNKIKRGDGTFRFGESFSVGIDFFWRMLGLLLIILFAVVVVVLAIAMIIIAAIAVHWAFAIAVGLVLLPIGFGLIWMFTNMICLTQRALVVRNVPLADAIGEAYYLFRSRPGDNLIVFLIFIGLSIAFGIAGLVVWLVVGIPIAAVALAAGASLVPTVILVILLGLPVSIVLGGFTGTVTFNLFTLFYFELVEPSPAPPALQPSPGV